MSEVLTEDGEMAKGDKLAACAADHGCRLIDVARISAGIGGG